MPGLIEIESCVGHVVGDVVFHHGLVRKGKRTLEALPRLVHAASFDLGLAEEVPALHIVRDDFRGHGGELARLLPFASRRQGHAQVRLRPGRSAAPLQSACG
jgi:hypothetical protein